MSLTCSVFGTLPNGTEVSAYTLKNAAGTALTVTPYGCRILRLLTPDRDGRFGDVVLGHATLEEYLGPNFQGTFVGRYANRIGGASLTIDGATASTALRFTSEPASGEFSRWFIDDICVTK